MYLHRPRLYFVHHLSYQRQWNPTVPSESLGFEQDQLCQTGLRMVSMIFYSNTISRRHWQSLSCRGYHTSDKESLELALGPLILHWLED